MQMNQSVISEFIRLTNEGGSKEEISLLEKIIINSISECIKEDNFYSLSTEDIFSLIEKSELKDAESLKTFGEKMSEMKGENAPLLLNIINADDATLEECVTIISGLKECSICRRIGELYFSSLPDIRATFEKEEIKHEKPDDFEDDIFEASRQGMLSSIKYLIEECHEDVETKDDNGYTPLMFASLNGNLNLVKYLIEECHANVETKDNNGNHPLIAASFDGNLRVVKYLFEECHADPEAKNNREYTPLILASQEGHLEIVKYLVETCHANVETKNDHGSTPLSIASQEGHLEVVKYLIEECHAEITENAITKAKTDEIKEYLTTKKL